MGFKKVYSSLQEIFPQIDSRVLRAVAIEHSKSVDAAVEAVLTEIIPFFNERSRPTTPQSKSLYSGESSEVAIGSTSNSNTLSIPNGAISKSEAPLGGTSNSNTPSVLNVGTSNSEASSGRTSNSNTPSVVNVGTSNSEASAVPNGVTLDSHIANVSFVNTMDLMEVQHGNSLGNHQSFHGAEDSNNEPIYDTYDGNHSAECDTTENNLGALQMEGSEVPQSNLTSISDKLSESAGVSRMKDLLDFISLNESELETKPRTPDGKENGLEKPFEDCNTSMVGAPPIVNDLSTHPLESCAEMGELRTSDDVERSGANLSNDVLESGISTVRGEAVNLNDSMSQTSQTHIIEVLEEAIADARNNQTTLFSSMQSVISLMKTVELKEQAVERAKVEAAMGGNDTLVKLEELKQMIQHAKEANSMHAGEVYGEKSILASELRELQSRVLSLSDERDKSLAILDEMRIALVARLAGAEDDLKSAEQLKLDKENAAMKALADEELVMELVVQESKILRQQAEENAKLQEFLTDRGRVVDMLQGEIAVICQDVKVLKEKFDDNIPFSKSLSSSQTSCILASSVTSLNGSSPKDVDPVGDALELEPPMHRNIDQGLSEDTNNIGKENVGKAVVEEDKDDWELLSTVKLLDEAREYGV